MTAAQPARQERPLLGILLMGAGFLVLAFNDLFSKMMLNDNLPPMQIVTLRAALLLVLLIVYAAFRSWRGRPYEMTSRWPMHFMRSLVGFFSMWLFFISLKHLDMATMTIILFIGPFFIAVFAWAMLGERIPKQAMIAIVIGFLGALIVIAPWGTQSVPVFWLVVAFISAATWGLAMVMVRSLARTDDSLSIVITYTVLILGYGLVLLPFLWQPVSGRGWLLLGALALCQFAAQLLMAEAYMYASAATVAPVQYTQIVWTTLLSLMVFGTVPSAQTFLGGAVIIASGLYLILSQRRRA